MKSVYAFIHYAFGSVKAPSISVLGSSTSIFPTAFEYVDIFIFCFSSISLFTCMRIACSSSLSSLFKFSSGVVRRSTGVERLVLFHLPAELEFLCGR